MMRTWVFLLCFTLFLESCRKPELGHEGLELEQKATEKGFEKFKTTNSFLTRIPQDSALLYLSSNDILGLSKFLDIKCQKTLLTLGSIDSKSYKSSNKLWQHWLQAQAVIEVRQWRKSLHEPDIKLSWQEPFLEFLSSRQGHEELGNFSLPPVIVALQENNSKKRSEVLNQISQKLDFLKSNPATTNDLILPIESAIFEGFEVNITQTLKLLNIPLELNLLSEQKRSRLQQVLSKKKLVLLCGELDNNVVIFVGSSPSQLRLTNNQESTILDHEAFLPFKTKKHTNIDALAYISKDLLLSLKEHSHIGKSISKGLRTGLNETNSITDTTNLERALDKLQSREFDMLERYDATDFAAIITDDNSVLIESYGGYHIPLFSLKESHSLSLPEDAQKYPFSLQANFEPEGLLHAMRWLSSIEVCSQEIENLSKAHNFPLKNDLIRRIDSNSFTPITNKISEHILPYLGSEISLMASEQGSMKKGAIRVTHNNVAALQEGVKQLYAQRPTTFRQEKGFETKNRPSKYQTSRENNHLVWSDSLNKDNPYCALDSNTATVASNKELLDLFLTPPNSSNSQGVSIHLKTQAISCLPFPFSEITANITESEKGPKLRITLQN